MWFLINPLHDSLPLYVKNLIRKYPAVKQRIAAQAAAFKCQSEFNVKIPFFTTGKYVNILKHELSEYQIAL